MGALASSFHDSGGAKEVNLLDYFRFVNFD